MKLNSLTCHFIFHTAFIIQFILPMDCQQEYQAEGNTLDRCLECMIQQDENFVRENACIVQQARLSVEALQNVIVGIDHDRRQLFQGAACRCRSCFLQQQRNEAQWIMLGHTREHIEKFVVFLQAYVAVYNPLPDTQLSKNEHEPIGLYLNTLNGLFNIPVGDEEMQFLKESKLVDKRFYALVKTRDIIGSHDVQMLYKQTFDHSLKQLLNPYDFCPRSPGPCLQNRMNPNGEQMTVPDYLFAHVGKVFFIQT